MCGCVATCYLYAPKIMQSNPVCSALGARNVLISRRYSQLLNVISAFKCELHLSPIHSLPLTILPQSRLLHVQIFGHLNVASTAAAAAAESWPIKWAAVSEARPSLAKRFQSQLQYFLVPALPCPPALDTLQPVVTAHRFTGCGCAMLFGLRSKLTSVLFVRFPFALLRHSFAFFAADPTPDRAELSALLCFCYIILATGAAQAELDGRSTATALGCCFCIFLSAFSFNLRN